jgi:uncharacterized membrane protein HdeD (DUF308 family)
MTTVDPDPMDVAESGLAAIGKHWGLVLALGITSVIVGILAVVWPGATILVVAILVAAWLLVSGVFQVVRGFSHGLSGGMRALLFISGGLSIILGLFAISGIWRSVEILAIFIAIAFLFRGFGMLFEAGESSIGRGWSIFGGIVMLIGGFVVLAWPGKSLLVLAWVTGIWLIVGGIFEIIVAFKLRSVNKDLNAA